jgi:hypothetical protein
MFEAERKNFKVGHERFTDIDRRDPKPEGLQASQKNVCCSKIP